MIGPIPSIKRCPFSSQSPRFGSISIYLLHINLVGFHPNESASSSSAGQSHAHSRTFTHTHLHFDHILVADRHDQLDIIIICPTTFSLYHSFTLFAILHLCSSSPPYRFHSHSHVRSVVMNSLYLYDMAWYGRMKLCHIKHKLC